VPGTAIDPKVLAEGAGTIFLLSDGAPSRTTAKDRDYGESKWCATPSMAR
jgi:hypothetical protein